jgi:hypothetical protein
MLYDNLSSVSQNGLKFYQQLTGEERRIPFIFDDFHFCRSRVIGLDMTKNRIFTLCCMITWVVFLRMVWNFISSLPVRTGGSLSFLVGTISTVLVMEIGWIDVGSGGYILVSCAHSNTIFFYFNDYKHTYLKLYDKKDKKWNSISEKHRIWHLNVAIWFWYEMWNLCNHRYRNNNLSTVLCSHEHSFPSMNISGYNIDEHLWFFFLLKLYTNMLY